MIFRGDLKNEIYPSMLKIYQKLHYQSIHLTTTIKNFKTTYWIYLDIRGQEIGKKSVFVTS